MPDAMYGPVNNLAGMRYCPCFTCGATVQTKDLTQHTNFHKNFTNVRSEDMSRVSWCDYGDHAYKRGVAGSVTLNGVEYDENNVAHNTDMDACPDHNPLNIAKQAAKYQISPDAYKGVTTPPKDDVVQ